MLKPIGFHSCLFSSLEQQKFRVHAQVQWYPLVQQDEAFSSKVTQKFPSSPCNIHPLAHSLTRLSEKEAASLV